MSYESGRERRKKESALIYSRKFFLNNLVVITAVAFLIGFIFGHSEGMLLLVDQFFEISIKDDTIRREPIQFLGDLLKNEIELNEFLRKEYGDYFKILFDKVTLNKLFVISERSKEALLRKMMIRIVENKVSPKAEGTRFTWVTAGDSFAAGHGNLFRQSYTAVLESTVKDAFKVAGIEFKAKNYGMGWLSSGPELALCMESIYGSNIDILSWDFQLTDTPKKDHVPLWVNRAGIHPSNPVLFLMDSNSTERYQNHFEKVDIDGLSSVLLDHDFFLQIQKERLPDVHDSSISQKSLPKAIQYHICAGGVEGLQSCEDVWRNYICEDYNHGSLCLQHKYDLQRECRTTRYQRSWTPGWKTHLFKGRLLGYFLVQMLGDALIKLDKIRRLQGLKTWQNILQFLMQREEDNKEQFINSKLPKDLIQHYPIPFSTLFRKQVMCHTALFPAEIRYQGILTESNKKGYGPGQYELGLNENTPYRGSVLPLIHGHGSSSRCDHMDIDYKDYFLVTSKNKGGLMVTLPNHAEIATYYHNNYKQSGHAPSSYILICSMPCKAGEKFHSHFTLSSFILFLTNPRG